MGHYKDPDYKRKYNERRKASGVCPWCGKPKDRFEDQPGKKPEVEYFYCRECRPQAARKTQRWNDKEPEKYRESRRLARAGFHAKRYGITTEEYLALFEEAGGICCICQRTGRRMVLDHCHRTRVIRGVICSSCNTAISWFKDDPETCQRAAEYLLASKEKG
jgi:Autographiviridae endonuclease VII